MTLSFGIRQAVRGDEQQLRDIALAAKASWGYDRERVAAWAATLDLFGEGAPAAETFVAETDGSPVGWMRLVPEPFACILEDLWVEPNSQRRGIGSSLFRLARTRARALGAQQLEWEAEPNALAFYERMGGRHLTSAAPSEWGRLLPRMALSIDEP